MKLTDGFDEQRVSNSSLFSTRVWPLSRDEKWTTVAKQHRCLNRHFENSTTFGPSTTALSKVYQLM